MVICFVGETGWGAVKEDKGGRRIYDRAERTIGTALIMSRAGRDETCG